MSDVPLTLLGLLHREPSHGYDLKRDYDAYFGREDPFPSVRSMPPSPALPGDGKVVQGATEAGPGSDRKRYAITDVGKREVEAWLNEPIGTGPTLQSLLFVKVVLALMLEQSATQYLDMQRAAHLEGAGYGGLTPLKRTGGLVDALLADHGLFHLEADLRWIDITEARLPALAEVVRG